MESQPDPSSASVPPLDTSAVTPIATSSGKEEMPTDVPANLSTDLPADVMAQLPASPKKGAGLRAILAKIPGLKPNALQNFLRSLKNKIRIPSFGKKKSAPATEAAPAAAPSASSDYSGPMGKVKEGGAYLVTSVIHRDHWTRFSTWMFWLSIAGLIAVGVVGLQSFKDLWKKRGPSAQELAAQAYLERAHRREEIDKVTERSYEVGGFSIPLVEPKGTRISAGLMNIVELDIVVECDTPDTKRSLELRPQKTKDQITLALSPLDREDLLTGEGKKRLKRAILDQLNSWLTQGHVMNVYFQKVLVE